MEYMLILNEESDAFAARGDERSGEYWAAWGAWLGKISESGVVKAGSGLLGPETATTVSARDGRRTVQDGPFPDSKEHLGGYFVIDVPDLDAALASIEGCPAITSGSVEIRPLMPPMAG